MSMVSFLGVGAGGASCGVGGAVSSPGLVKVWRGSFSTTLRLSILSFPVTDQPLLLPEKGRHSFSSNGYSPRRP